MDKFKEFIDLLSNNETDKAREALHDAIVEESRRLYSEIICEEEMETVEEEFDNFDEADQTDDFVMDIESDEEGFDNVDSDDEFEDDMDDLESDMEAMPDSSGEFDSDETEDRIVDLEAALDELKAEFDAMVGDMDDEDEDMDDDEDEDMDMDMDDEDEDMDMDDEDEDMDMDMDMDDEDEDDDVEENYMREYVEKVAAAKKEDHKAVSPVASKKALKGEGSAKNMNQGGANSNPDGTSSPKSPKSKDMNTGNRNVPGASAGNLEKVKQPSMKEQK